MRPITAAVISGVAVHGGAFAEQARRPNRTRLRELRAWRARSFAAYVIFAGVLTGGWMIGGISLAVPPPQEQVGPRPPGAQSAGWIVQQLPDGESCNYTVFDNITQQVGGRMTDACQADPRQNVSWRGFSWGRNDPGAATDRGSTRRSHHRLNQNGRPT